MLLIATENAVLSSPESWRQHALEGTISSQAAGAALMGGMAAAAWHVIPRKIKMDKMHDAAVELLRQFKPHGPPPDELERYLTDPNSGTAIIYRKL